MCLIMYTQIFLGIGNCTSTAFGTTSIACFAYEISIAGFDFTSCSNVISCNQPFTRFNQKTGVPINIKI